MIREELQVLARERGGMRGDGVGCRCCVCGCSSFESAGPRSRVLGQTFTDYDLLGEGTAVCVGCASLMAGKPGCEPPPLRMVNVAAGEGWIEYPDRAGIYARMMAPDGVRVLSWAVSRKKHHWLRAGLCRPDRLLVGSDDGCIEYVPERDAPLVEAIRELLASPTGTASLLSREAIRTGEYHPEAVRKFGPRRWGELEATVKRWRPSLLLELLTTVTPLSTGVMPEKGTNVIDADETRASTLLARLATASLVRRKDGKVFWGGFLRHRVERFRCYELKDMVSRLMDVLSVPATDPATLLVLNDLALWSDDDQKRIAKIIETKAPLMVALAFEQCKSKNLTDKGALL